MATDRATDAQQDVELVDVDVEPQDVELVDGGAPTRQPQALGDYRRRPRRTAAQVEFQNLVGGPGASPRPARLCPSEGQWGARARVRSCAPNLLEWR